MRKCPFCAQEIEDGSIKCEHCGSTCAPTPQYDDQPCRFNDTLGEEATQIPENDESITLEMSSLFASRYEILSEGKKGGMGVVYKVRDTKLNKIKALKLIHPRLLAHPQALSRFRQEVAIAQDLHHPRIVSVYDLDEYNGREFFTMEWVEGPSLRDLLTERRKENKPFSLEEASLIISPLSDALSYAHLHTVHRDIKPENILFEGSAGSAQPALDRLKLTDFGIAKMLSPSQFLTTSLQMGTPYYMAPEQKLDASQVDHRADIYGVGVILFELLTLENTIGPYVPSKVNSLIPPDVDSIFSKAVELKAEDRYETIEDLAGALRDVAEQERRKALGIGDERGPWPKTSHTISGDLTEIRRGDQNSQGKQGVEATADKEDVEQAWEIAEPPQKKPRDRVAVIVLIVGILCIAAVAAGYAAYRHFQEQAAIAGRIEKERREKQRAEEKKKQEEQADLKKKEERAREGQSLMDRTRLAIKKGNLSDARRYLDQAKALMPDDSKVADLERQIQSLEQKALKKREIGDQQRKALAQRKEEERLATLREAEEWRRAEIQRQMEKTAEEQRQAQAAEELRRLEEKKQAQTAEEQKRVEERKKAREAAKTALALQLAGEFVFVNGGCFAMGDTFVYEDRHRRPVQNVCVQSFHLGKYEVTQAQWIQIMGTNPPGFSRGRNYPVDSVTWDEVQTFIKKLNERTGKNYRLPTGAEWEYGARSGGKREEWAGTSSGREVGEFAWYGHNSGHSAHPVGRKRPNSLGVHDMSGNVREWVHDLYFHEGLIYREVRGGSFATNWLRDLRISHRSMDRPSFRSRDVGFRLLLPAQ